MSDEVLTLGDSVRTARESAGLSQEQVSDRTRLRATLVRELEQGRVASCGGDVYARGHLRAIAGATGTDAAVLLAAYDREHGAAPAGLAPLVAAAPLPLAVPRSGSLRLPTATSPERSTPRWGAAVAVAAAVLAGLFVVGSLDRTPVGSPSDSVIAGASQEPEQPAPDPALDPGVAPDPALPPGAAPGTVGPDAVAEAPPVTGAALRLRVLGGPSWVSVSGADGVLFEGLLEDGSVQDFTDPEQLRLVVGDAGVVSLVCGGKDLPAGGRGEVRRFTCSTTGLVPA